jgi:hypothetical protein
MRVYAAWWATHACHQVPSTSGAPPGKLYVTYDQDGDLSTATDVKPVKITATSNYWGPMEKQLSGHSE